MPVTVTCTSVSCGFIFIKPNSYGCQISLKSHDKHCWGNKEDTMALLFFNIISKNK